MQVAFFEFTRSDFVFGPGWIFIFIIWVHDVFQFWCRMFCFFTCQFGFEMQPSGWKNRDRGIQIFFLKSVTLVFGCVLVRKQWFQSCFKIEPPWLRYLSTHASCKVQHDEQSGTKNRERNEYGLVEPFLFTLKFAMIFPLNHHFPGCWSAQIVDGGHALACAGAFWQGVLLENWFGQIS